MSASHYPESILTNKQLQKNIAINGGAEDLEFRLPTPTEKPDNVEKPWVHFFAHQIRSGLRIPPPPFLLDLVNLYSIPLHQIHPFAICRAITIYIICSFYGIEDSLGLIRATHIIKHTSSIYTLSAKPVWELAL